jgi:hypothetical protein
MQPVCVACAELEQPHTGTKPLPDKRPEALCNQRAADAVGYGHKGAEMKGFAQVQRFPAARMY